MRDSDARYFERIEDELDRAMAVAGEARERGGDPEPEVEIPVATDMADRVENILGIDGVAERVRELEADHSREEAALALVEDFVEGTVGDFDSRAGKIEGAVRTAVALLTEGVVAAPIEGIDRVEVLENDEGTEFVNVYYAGPIRSAGGTAQALSVLVADYARSLLGIDEYVARRDEIGRYAEEVDLYDEDTGLQYSPSQAEAEFIAEHMPIMLDGEATGGEEVSGHRDLERVDTNAPRGGMCLVLAEGIALKAPKIQRYTREIDAVDWPWLQDLIDGTYDGGDGGTDATDDSGAADAEAEASDDDAEGPADGPPRVEPSKKYLRDLIAGRPVFSHPSEPGGFRLRYGRARNHGFATAGVHPATMHLIDDFLATGTQVKTELPGKAAGIVPVDSIEGPTVRLANGEVRRIDDPEEALEVRNGVEAVLDLGEYLVNYGEFVENNQPLAPAAYTVEWWIQEFEAAGGPLQELRDRPDVDLEGPTVDQALEWAREYDVPLHPAYTPLWHDVTVDQVLALADAIDDAEILAADGAALERRGTDAPLSIPRREGVTETLEALLVEHTQREDDLPVPEWRPLAVTLGFDVERGETPTRDWTPDDISTAARTYADGDNAIEAVNELAPFAVRERAPTRVGNRMGRPEKSETRELSPAVHTLFPIGEAGGDQRSVGDAVDAGDSVEGTKGQVSVDVGRRECEACGERTFRPRCPACGASTRIVYECPDCEREVEPDSAGRAECPGCETRAWPTERRTVDVGAELEAALDTVGERPASYDTLKAVKGLSSKEKTPEPLEKGILRAKHGVSTFKDGTVRYDMTDLPVTSVRPEELDVTVEHFRELGYETDVHGDPLEHDDQLVELKVQDVVLSEGAAEHLQRTADFVDDLLDSYYGLDPFYDVDERDDLVGELVFGMAPHTSAAVVGRVVGFTTAAVGYAHPYFHASKRRNCFHPETKIWVADGTGDWQYAAVEDVVEEHLDEPRSDAVGTLVEELDGDRYVPSLSSDGEPRLAPIESVSKHPSSDHLVRIETRSGRSLTVTPDHSMRSWEGGVEERAASQIEQGDLLPTPKAHEFEGTPGEIDLLEAFMESSGVPNDDLMVRGMGSGTIKEILDDATAAPQYLDPVADELGVSDSTVYNWVSRDSIPVSVLLELFDRDAVLARVPETARLSVKRDTAEVARIFRFDEDVAGLLGYYAAEGFTRREPGNFYQTTICTPEDDVRETLVETFDRVLNVEAYEENEWKLTVSSRLVSTLFSEILGAGGRAETKRIPTEIVNAPLPQLREFLAGYFSGDGSTASDRVEIRAHTVSDELKEDLLAALRRFGISATCYEEGRSPETGAVAAFYDGRAPEFETWVLKITSENALRFAERVGFDLPRKQETLTAAIEAIDTRPQRVFGDGGEVWLDEVTEVEIVESDVEYTYSLTVSETHTLVANDLYTGQCDGDEDCVMLLMDGLLNFSKIYLPDKRGGRMDAPLVMSSRIDPSEIDDEAHNMDVVEEYPLEFYEATREMADPETVDVTIAEDSVGTDDQYRGFRHTHDTSNIAAGPSLSAYKTLGSMEEKMDHQLELARTLRAVDETDVAERVIEYHFLPDLIGNLRAFSRQETRCHDCGTKYRRMPLSYQCRECGGDVHLTVHEGSVTKYMETAKRVAEEYGAREYTKQRLEILQRSIDRIFENDQNKQSGIADFM